MSNEILSKTGDYTSFEFSQAFCQKCNSDHDVVNFIFGQREVVLCQNCRISLLKNLKKGADLLGQLGLNVALRND